MVAARAVTVLLVVATMAAAACKNRESDNGAPLEKVELDDADQALLARRDALVSARARILKERSDLQAERDAIKQSGGDTAAIDERANQLNEEENLLDEQEADLIKRLSDELARRSEVAEQLASQTSQQNRASAREVLMASREKGVAQREARLAQREKELAQREAALALREKETCGTGQPIVQTITARGSKYSKSDVVPMLKRSRETMTKNGILPSDLPAAARSLENEATEAMAKGDYGQAHFAANQLLRSVKAIRIDKSFVAAKIGRLNQEIKGKSLGQQEKQVSELFRQATSSFGDGKFKRANSRLNKIYAIVR